MPSAATEAVLSGDPPVTVRLRPDPRARRFSLRVAHGDGRITLTFPPRAGRTAALAFMREREGWLRATLADLPQTVAVAPGISLPVLGTPLVLVAAPLRRARRDGDRLLVPPGRGCGPAVAAHLRAVAHARLEGLCTAHAATLGRPLAGIALRDTRSRWGSCTAAGRLMFSWRLALAPVEVFDYVAAHEAAHLVEMNHSPAFWRLVEGLCPDWRRQRAWLRSNGGALHRWRFDG
ncbi:M48 family metallopeptidase [Rhodobaculum claviforme]|uniref:YgjP-like metallopeptidase domain-containing protein n=1 Tax=Rhodobaculum claviforme TaxID=1549854 RepID=A0A934WJ87_9RHOB|nr:SprT family zinc-dependent metalloprotease [Rhodobaculum claviforme]MBK5927766.1 hypothetical protein [Rhodobaculum claviforme]